MPWLALIVVTDVAATEFMEATFTPNCAVVVLTALPAMLTRFPPYTAAVASITLPTTTSVGSPLVAVACSAKGPAVFESVALPATLYQPFAISDTAPDGDANAPPFLLNVTVTVAPVRPVMWSDDCTIRNTSAVPELPLRIS